LKRPVTGWQLRFRRSAAWRAVVGDVPPNRRVVDVVGALVLLTVLAPVMLVVAAVIKVRGEGPVLLWQTRVGRRGRCFACPTLRITSRCHLNHLPRVWAVLAGDLSLVGPRPASPREVDCFGPQELRRLEVAPGLTGGWLVDGHGHADLAHVDRPSLWCDAAVLLRTPPALLRTGWPGRGGLAGRGA
jgi:lipopolysaccharide/colanic/teichoic acid biosynthesis glycosyltransferase